MNRKKKARKVIKLALAVLFIISFNLISVGITFSPQLPITTRDITFRGIASWYSCNDKGILETTANMEIFDDTKLTCAIWDLPFNTYLKVTNLDNGKSVIIRVNDRGPAKRLVRKGRIIDLTKEAFRKIGDLKQGLINVEIEILYFPPFVTRISTDYAMRYTD